MKKCPKCGGRIKSDSSFCDNCGTRISGGRYLKKSKHKSHKALWITIVLTVILLLGTVVAFLLQRGSEKKATVTNAEDAIAFLKETGAQYGFKNALTDLTEEYTESVNGECYYRFQQNYQGMPVYGKSVVCVTDDTGKVINITGNITDVEEEISLFPTVTDEMIESCVEEYLEDILGYSPPLEYDILPVSDNNLCIYFPDYSGKATLAYHTSLFVANSEEAGCYDMVINAQSGEILCCNTSVYADMESFSLPDNSNGTSRIEVNKEADENGNVVYSMVDTKRHIRIYNANNGTLRYEIYDYDGGLVLDREKNLVKEDVQEERIYPVWISSKGVTQPVSRDNPPKYDKEAVSLLSNIQATYDFYSEVLGIQGVGVGGAPTWIDGVYNDFNSSDIQNAYCWGLKGIAMQDMLISFGSWNTLSTDVVAHEYTHAVEGRRSGMNYEGESGAIMEALSDIFGELAEAWASDKQPDWIHNGSRNMKLPESSGNPAVYQGKNWIDTANTEKSNDWGGVHTNNTVLSHAAYLMWNGIDGTESKKISEHELAQLWYRAMLMMPSNCSFYECRKLVEWAALSMDELSAAERKCISEAFDAVGILSTKDTLAQADYNVSNRVILRVFDKDGEKYGGASTLKIVGSIDVDSPSSIEEEFFGISYNKTEHILPGSSLGMELNNGTYSFALSSDCEPEKVYTFSVRVDDEYDDEEIILLTNFEPVLVVKIDQPTSPAHDDQGDSDGTAESAFRIDDVQYNHQLVDESYYDEEGLLRIEYTYDRIVLRDNAPSLVAINKAIEQDANRFLEQLTIEQKEELVQSPWIGDGYFWYTAESEVTNNSDGILSIMVSTNWCMGGVNTLDYYGLNYNLNTGEPLDLTKLFKMDEDQLVSRLQDIAWSYLCSNRKDALDEFAHETLYGYGLSDLNFYFQDGQLVLTFPTYSLGYGASGSFIVPTGLFA